MLILDEMEGLLLFVESRDKDWDMTGFISMVEMLLRVGSLKEEVIDVLPPNTSSTKALCFFVFVVCLVQYETVIKGKV